jgi:hypothetical protein
MVRPVPGPTSRTSLRFGIVLPTTAAVSSWSTDSTFSHYHGWRLAGHWRQFRWMSYSGNP